VLIVINNLKLGGGAQRIAAEVGSKLNERGHDVSYFTIYHESPMYDFKGELIDFGQEKRPSSLKISESVFKAAKKLKDISEEKNIDTIISFLMEGNLCALLSRTLFGVDSKIIVSMRNNPLQKKKRTRLQIKWLYPKADRVVALSKGVEEILKKDFSLDNTTTIYNLQDIEKFEKLGKEELKEEHKDFFDNQFVFITVGSLTEQKGHWHLFRCFKKITQNTEDVKLLVLGEGELRERSENLLKRLSLEEKVFLPGVVDNVFPYLREADCFVLSSIYEGFGNVLTEALSQDLPVISTDCPAGPREILCPDIRIEEDLEYPHYGEYGVITENFDDELNFETLEERPLSEVEEMFAETMLTFKDDEKIIERYSNGSNRVKRFEAEKIIKEWEEVI